MTYAISTTDGDHLGFILLAGGPDSGDCLVRSLPRESGVFNMPESEFLYELQQLGEFQWERVSDEFRIYDANGETVLVEKQGRMTGSKFVFLVEELSK